MLVISWTPKADGTQEIKRSLIATSLTQGSEKYGKAEEEGSGNPQNRSKLG